ncbi:hypothetical protein XFF6992_50148 [Xanthomonas citri pv. fuscans]|uniref:Uncharacterized protein n=1 Tax=Xanthomonas campestris pv. phaseoli TaxID=317013 RepID=A0A7Z7NJ67_XANCH|nr:hypothetical protein XFF6990_80154 [Xanthomonas citri pv. fuscans]SOO20886.1 hypothetical protein XFF6992_50148 [Xanthomonas citri pv. fuscans]SOO26630.1 hypothetical protein XFF6991_570195 [Xanthomonas phaseoli pv. phaseoli]SOO33832.1 hypothetical protein XFF6994_320025 [Xanthomonas citri pv. fuscans]
MRASAAGPAQRCAMPRDVSALAYVSAPAVQSVPEVRGKRNATGQDGPPACVRCTRAAPYR